jgi:UDP-N-acetylmuramate dehydrogenase
MSDRRAALVEHLRELAPALRGKLAAEVALAPYTWFRVGGPAEALYSPADEDDLAYFLQKLPRDIPALTIGVGSNLIVRDGGVRGLVIRLGGKGFGAIATAADCRVVVGAAALDSQVARAAADAGIDGFVFLRGVPGSIGGALRMNAGAYGGEIGGLLVEARGVDRGGATHVFANVEMGFSYRHCSAPADVTFTRAVFQGRPGAPEAIRAEMERMMREREAIQPIHDKTGGSTFKNPPGEQAWRLIEAAGCRGLAVGGAQVSTLHCNFLINRGAATAADIEALGEEVRRRVKASSGVELEWEIKRIGEAG